MNELQVIIPPFEYIGGKNVTERMKIVTNTKDFKSLGEALGISKGTISTWHQRELTPFEVIIRLHLKTGASIRYLALGEGEAFPVQHSKAHTSKKNENKTLFDLDHFSLSNGKLAGAKTLAFDKTYLDKWNVVNAMAIDYDGSTYIVDKETRQAVAGTYLVDMDGLLSLNDIQRLPGRKLAISFNGSTLTIEEDEVRVIGRVALVLEKR